MRFYKAAKPVMQFEYTRRNGVFRSAARVLRFGERRVDLCEIAACCAELIHDVHFNFVRVIYPAVPLQQLFSRRRFRHAAHLCIVRDYGVNGRSLMPRLRLYPFSCAPRGCVSAWGPDADRRRKYLI